MQAINDEMRDQILLETEVLGMTAKEVAEKHRISRLSVTKQRAMYHAVKGGDWLGIRETFRASTTGINLLTWAISRTKATPPDNFVEEMDKIRSDRRARVNGCATTRMGDALPPTANVETCVKETPEPETQPAGAKAYIPAPSAELGWQTRLKVSPDKVCMTVYFNGVPVVSGYSKVRGDKELDLMQAISYAAHMCYKLVEQKKLGGK